MRKENKLRPYRVDYFNIDEMEEVDQALVRSVVVRAVTAAEAAGQVLADNEALPIVLIRSHRYYKTLGTHKKGVYKAVEDLFAEKQALIVMEEVEKYRVSQTPTSGPNSPATVAVVADLNGMVAHDAHEQTMDTFVPNSVPEGKRVPDVTNTLPVTAQDVELGAQMAAGWAADKLIQPDQAVGPDARPPFAPSSCDASLQDEPYPLWAKIVVYGGILLLVI